MYKNRFLISMLSSIGYRHYKIVLSLLVLCFSVGPVQSATQKSNKFNPAIGLILGGTLSSYSEDNSTISGYPLGEEGGRSNEGFSIGESELNLSSNIDDKFSAWLTLAAISENGGTSMQLEEAWVETQGGFLPWGLNLKFGRALWTIGYLNQHHRHTDDFTNRPLPSRVFLNNAYNDDGFQLSGILPLDYYVEWGVGAYRGDSFPFGGSDGEGLKAWSIFVRTGGDWGTSKHWRFGSSFLSGKASTRESNGGQLKFIGNSHLWVNELRIVQDLGHSRELVFQAEYMQRWEKGEFEDLLNSVGPSTVDNKDEGWYAQIVWKFRPIWRIGLRTSQLSVRETPVGMVGSILDASNNRPQEMSLMLDYSNSEFSTIRLQLGQEKVYAGSKDQNVQLQYIMSLGAHPAHAY